MAAASINRFAAKAPSLMVEPTRPNLPEWSVTELSAALKRTVEDAYERVRVRGEVSGYRGPHSSGHVYFALKDQGAKIDAIIWKGQFGRMRFRPEEGLEVIASGKLTTYPGKSSYQIVIDALEPAGAGALMALLEERKRKLAAEGLFSEARKQLLPFLPEVIGVVTSPTGAVIRDILHRLDDRFPRHVLVWPVRVQGEGSAEEVAAAIRGFNALDPDGPIPRPDVLIVARGGGSLEDLWSFNEEIVVRAAAESDIPLIAAVGHETDVTLIDFAADRRAPTPTAAAEMAVPVRLDLLAQTGDFGRRLTAAMRRLLEGRRTEWRAAARALPSPEALTATGRQRLDLADARLVPALRMAARRHEQRLAQLARRLEAQSPRARLAGQAARLDGLSRRLAAAFSGNTRAQGERLKRDRDRLATLADRLTRGLALVSERRHARLDRLDQLLRAFSYQGVLARGFAVVRDAQGLPVRGVAGAPAGAEVEIEFADGRRQATIR
jgi:exodeoxyribonuclease VII large subunit